MSVIMADNIHKIFKQRVAENPGGVALVYGEKKFSYGELDQLSDALAVRLDHQGVQTNDIVALLLNRSPEMIIAMLAVLKCGAAYMPLEKNNPVARSVYCLHAAKVKLMISDRDCKDLETADRTVYRFSHDALNDDTGAWQEKVFSSETPAYIMFTSGTTSEPKGVVVPHRAVTRLVIDTNYICIKPDDAILQFSTQSFDASTFEIWGALLNGASLVLYTGAVLDPNLFKRHITDYNITILWLTAALFHLFADKYMDALRPVKILLAGGDVLHKAAVRKVIDEIDGIKLINGYGPTENTTFTCCHVMTSDNKPEETVAIGRPISGTEVFIVNEEGEQVKPGETGELYAAGRGVALGYLNAKPGEGPFFYDRRLSDGLIYRTGDLVRQNQQGFIEFMGRQDSQVKIRGYRISLEEIKAHLIDIPAVKEAVVSCQKSDGGDQLLVAYLQTEEDQELDAKAVRTYLSARVPPYMIPDKISIGTTMPITQNGKVDSKKVFSTTV
ncbi:amino acid adenylation domain-containing protein [Undibacterium sp. TJN19]|uniref:amino acid adenylation domain-containing protein n=1 Tax=Undibacterium sp. TJN19 TaxID=3413055 RepID=UPI003BF15232